MFDHGVPKEKRNREVRERTEKADVLVNKCEKGEKAEIKGPRELPIPRNNDSKYQKVTDGDTISAACLGDSS